MAARALTALRSSRHLLRNDSQLIVRNSKRNGGGGPEFHEEGYAAFWKSYVEYYKKIVPVVFVAVPLAAYIGIETEHADEGNWEQKYVVYPYTHCRWKKLPIGDGSRTFFHNDTVNPVPGEGYVKDYDKHHGTFLEK